MNNQHPRFLTISWIALAAAIVVPPVGIILGIIAIAKSKKLPNRPGNKAMAISSIPTALSMILILAPMIGGFFAFEMQRDEAYEEMRRVEEEMYMERERIEKEMQMEMEAREGAMREAEEAVRQAERIQKAMER
jgi:ABC-type dipeptide/oligopeptide/nickel transport system permease component